MARFDYQPLQTGEIRLIRIKKAPNAKDFELAGGFKSETGLLYAPIECEIAAYRLADCPPFTALSYTWGTEQSKRDIKLNGFSIDILPNLNRFLRHARDDLNLYPTGAQSPRRDPDVGERTYFLPLEDLAELAALRPRLNRVGEAGPAITSNPRVALQYVISDPNPWPMSNEGAAGILIPSAKAMNDMSTGAVLENAQESVPSETAMFSPIGYLWIDALCINQESLDERNAQVAIMRDVYKAAQRIVVWLGLGCKCHDLEYHFLATEAYRLYGVCVREGIYNRFSGYEMPDITVDAIQCLGENPWWSRSWILQEASTPQATMELWVGASRVSFEDVKLTHYGILWAMAADRQAEIPPGYNQVLDKLASSRMGDSGMTFLDLLVQCRSFEATNPLDKIYAFLGIYADARGESPLNIDYSLPASVVFTTTAIHVLQQEKNPAILAHCGSHRNETASPSWAPDFSVSGDYHAVIRSTSNQGCSFSFPISFEDDMKCLVVTGVIIDQVAEIVEPLLRPEEKIPEAHMGQFAMESPEFLSWFQSIARMAYPNGVDTEYPGGEDTTAAMNLLFMGIQEELEPDHSHLMGPPFLQALAEKGFSGHFDHILVTPIVRRKYPWLTFFKTTKNYLGIGDEATIPGDTIVGVDGLATPLVLRKERPDTWRLLGPAFVVGMMNGGHGKIGKEAVFRIY